MLAGWLAGYPEDVFSFRTALIGAGLAYYVAGRALDRVMLGGIFHETEHSVGIGAAFALIALLVAVGALLKAIRPWLERQSLDEVLLLGFVTLFVLSMPSMPEIE
jgi:hypothetical protein